MLRQAEVYPKGVDASLALADQPQLSPRQLQPGPQQEWKTSVSCQAGLLERSDGRPVAARLLHSSLAADPAASALQRCYWECGLHPAQTEVTEQTFGQQRRGRNCIRGTASVSRVLCWASMAKGMCYCTCKGPTACQHKPLARFACAGGHLSVQRAHMRAAHMLRCCF